eukprot:387975_1
MNSEMTQTLVDLLRQLKYGSNTNWRMIYRASKDGFDTNVFHSKCDSIKHTLSIVETEQGDVFGGYTSKKWNTNAKKHCTQVIQDDNAAIVLIHSMRGYKPQIFRALVQTEAEAHKAKSKRGRECYLRDGGIIKGVGLLPSFSNAFQIVALDGKGVSDTNTKHMDVKFSIPPNYLISEGVGYVGNQFYVRDLEVYRPY